MFFVNVASVIFILEFLLPLTERGQAILIQDVLSLLRMFT